MNRVKLRRSRESAEDSQASTTELFFDLVFVFAITQLAHYLLAHMGLRGIWQTLVLVLAVWMQWVYTTWVTNWLAPGQVPVRLLLVALMGLGLLLSSSIPAAYAEHGLVFAVTMSLMHVGRTAFALWALRGSQQEPTFLRMLVWAIPPTLLWLWGGLSGSDARLWLWGAGTLLTYLPTLLGYWVPGLGRSSPEEWDVDGAHMAERTALFIIIVLGEELMMTGTSFSKLHWESTTVLAFAIAFVGTVASWWLYFVANAEVSKEVMGQTQKKNTGRLARDVYTLIHLPIVLGLIFIAVGDEYLLTHPHDPASIRRIFLGVLCGPALFLLGNLLFKWDMLRLPVSHLLGLVVLGVLALLSGHLDTLTVSALGVLTFLGIAYWETRAMPELEAEIELQQDKT